MTDQELEQRLREWYRAEVPAELAAPADLRSKVVAITRSSRPWRRPDHRRGVTLLAAAALVGLLVGTAVVGGVLDNSPDPVVVPSQPPFPSEGAAISSPSPTPQPATPSPTAEPCLTDTMTVLTGDAMHAATGADVGDVTADLGAGRGVYLGNPGFPRRGVVWAIGPGKGPARGIAAIVDPPVVFDVTDLSVDGTTALLRAGTVSINSPAPECVDLYAVRTDGSGAARLTPFRGGRSVSGAAFSPDGSRVAYTWWGSQDTITVLDIASGQEVDRPCGAIFGFSPNRIEWSPAGDRVAAACSGIVTIFDASGTTESVPIQSTREQLLFGWTDDGHLLVSTDGGGILSHDVESGTTTSLGHVDISGIELVTPSSGGFSPDGRWLAFIGGERGDVPGNDFRIVGYVVSTTGGTPIRILDEDEASSNFTWSTNGLALIATHKSGPAVDGVSEMILGRLDPATLKWSEVGPLLGSQGVWQIP